MARVAKQKGITLKASVDAGAGKDAAPRLDIKALCR